MRKNVNQEKIEGRIYDHDLTIKTVQNQQSANFGKEFIQGSVSVATDEEGLNVLPIHYTYVTELTNTGKPNSQYAALKRIMEEDKTWIKVGKENAMKARFTPAAALNDFYPQGGDQLVSQPRSEGGFITFITSLNEDETERRKFTFDTLITGVTLVEADEEKGTEEYAKITAAIFNFRNDLLPFPLVAKTPEAINYFMGLNASSTEPVYTKVWGEIINTTIKVEKIVESAFGSPSVDVSERSQREWVITGANPEPYVFDDEETMTVAEVTKAIQARNVALEEIKTRAKEYYNNKGNAISSSAPAPNTQVPQGKFNF